MAPGLSLTQRHGKMGMVASWDAAESPREASSPRLPGENNTQLPIGSLLS